MFYDGYADKGSCVGGGGHLAQGLNFTLPHSATGTATAQDSWRYCEKCHAMFYDGYADKGRCAASSGGHVAQGLNFVLPHSADKEIALLLYGAGAELGNFKFIADDTAEELVSAKKFDKANIVIKQTLDRATFVSALQSIASGQKIKELHIFSHSIGAGLYLGYHEPQPRANRAAVINAASSAGTTVTYTQVLDAETGALLTDHLIRDPLRTAQADLKAKFASGAMIKVWGCNSAVANWTYSDEDPSVFYWRALNTQHTPKPSIAQALADYFGAKVFGAGSGSHVEVRNEGKWITSDKFKNKTGHWPGQPQTLRLKPDRGDYNEFSPTGP
jgi:hypothetical protein